MKLRWIARVLALALLAAALLPGLALAETESAQAKAAAYSLKLGVKEKYTLNVKGATFATDNAKIGRALGIFSFQLLTVASVMAIPPKAESLIARYVILAVGLLLNFFIKLLNIPGLFGIMSFSNPSSVMNCAVFVLSETGALILVFYYLTARNKLETSKKRKLTNIFMSVVIALYVICFVLECIMIIKYRINIDLSRKYTLLSRALYCAAFVGTAVGFMLPHLLIREIKRPGEFIYSEDVEDEIDLIL